MQGCFKGYQGWEFKGSGGLSLESEDLGLSFWVELFDLIRDALGVFGKLTRGPQRPPCIENT